MRFHIWCFLLFAAFALVSCRYEDVAIEDIKGFKVNKMEDKKVFFQFEIKLNNPNNYPLKIKTSDLSLKLNNRNLGRLYLDETVSVPARNRDYVLVKSSVKTEGNAQDLFSLMLGSLFSGALDVHISGEVTGGTFLFPKKVHIDHAEKVNFSNR